MLRHVTGNLLGLVRGELVGEQKAPHFAVVQSGVDLRVDIDQEVPGAAVTIDEVRVLVDAQEFQDVSIML